MMQKESWNISILCELVMTNDKKMAFRDAEELSNLIMVDVNNRTSNCWHALYYCTKKKCAVYFSINSFCRQQSANHGGAHDHRG